MSSIIKKQLITFSYLSLLVFLLLCTINTQAEEIITEPIRTFEGHTDRVTSVVFSPDGQQILSGSWDKTLKLWDVNTGSLVRSFTGHTDSVNSVAFSPDGQTILSGSSDNTVKLWNVSTGQLIYTFIGHSGSVNSVAISSDGQIILSGSSDGTIKLWNISTKQLTLTLVDLERPVSVSSIAISSDKKTVLSGSGEMTRLWNLSTGEITKVSYGDYGHYDYVSSVAYCSDGQIALSGVSGKNFRVKLRNLSSWEVIKEFYHDNITSVDCNFDGQIILSGSSNKTIKLWNINTEELIRTFQGHSDSVNSVAFSPDGQTALSASSDETIKLWDLGLNTNESPTAVFTTSPTQGQTPFTVNLDGSQSTDSDGNIVKWQWSTSTGQNALGETATLIFTDIGTHTITLTVTDDDGDVATIQRIITVTEAPVIEIPNESPTAVFITSPTQGQTPLTINLDASQSTDSDGNIVKWQWSTSDGQNATGQTTSLTFTAVGTHTIALTVTDDDGAVATIQRTITVTEAPIIEIPNESPSAIFNISSTQGQVPFSVDLDANASFDSDGTIIEYIWTSSDGKSALGQNTQFTFNTIGMYTIELTIVDNEGATATAQKEIIVEESPNQAPIAQITVSPTSGDAPLIVNVNASQSIDYDGYIADYDWSISNGQTFSPSITFNDAGTYTISLTVTDDNGLTDTAQETVTVFEPILDPEPPIADIGISSVNDLTVNLDGSQSFDFDGYIVEYAWTADGQTFFGETPSITFDDSGTYSISLTITDNDGLSDTIQETVTVFEPEPEIVVPETIVETGTTPAVFEGDPNFRVTLDRNLDINVPFLIFQSESGDIPFWGRLRYIPTSDGNLLWEAEDYGEYSGNVDTNPTGAILTQDLQIIIPNITYQGALFSGSLSYVPTNDNRILFRLNNYNSLQNILVNRVLAKGQEVSHTSSGIRIKSISDNDVAIKVIDGFDEDGDKTYSFEIVGGDVEISLPDPNDDITRSFKTKNTRSSDSYVVNKEWDFTYKEFLISEVSTTWGKNRLPHSKQGNFSTESLKPHQLYNLNPTPIADLIDAVREIRYTFSLSEKIASQLLSSCFDTIINCFQNKEPVLFVHGFTPDYIAIGGLGGGEGTWNNFPRLLEKLGYVPFEFKWRTTARFEDVANDFGAAVDMIQRETGKQVHIIAHSFGGLLVRTWLQGLASDPSTPSATGKIASFTTLGTPHSGVADKNQCVSGIALPGGQDTQGTWNIDIFSFEGCQALTCHESGESMLGRNSSLSSTSGSLREIFEVGEPGELIAKLADFASYPLPNIDILVQIGLTTFRGLDDVIDEGDGLITYEGQRFSPSYTVTGSCSGSSGFVSEKTPEQLKNKEKISNAYLTETILDFEDSTLPNNHTDTTTGGYRHSTAINGDSTLDGNWGDDVSAEPYVECDYISYCLHDGFNNTVEWLKSHSSLATDVASYNGIVTELYTGIPINNVAIINEEGDPIAETDENGNFNFKIDIPFNTDQSFNFNVESEGYKSQILTISAPSISDVGSTPFLKVELVKTSLETVTGLKAVLSEKSNITLSWNAVQDADYYNIYSCRHPCEDSSNPIDKYVFIDKTESTSFNEQLAWLVINSDATLYYRVTAVKISSDSSKDESSFSESVSITVPQAGTNSTPDEVTEPVDTTEPTDNTTPDIVTGLIRTFEGHEGYADYVTSVAYSPDGQTAFSGGYNSDTNQTNIYLWNLSTGKVIRTFEGHTSGVTSVAYSPDGQTALSGSWDETMILWNLSTGKIIRTFEGHTRSVTSVTYSPDGQTALSGSRDKTIKLWDISTGQLIHSFVGHSNYVQSVAYSPDGQTALSGSYKEMKLWDVSTGQVIRSFEDYTDWVYSVAYSPDGQTALSGGGNSNFPVGKGEMKLWDISTGQLIHTFEGHTSVVTSVTYSPDGQTALSGSVDNTIKLWNVSTGQLIHSFVGYTDNVFSVAYSQDGQTALSNGRDWENGYAMQIMKLWAMP